MSSSRNGFSFFDDSVQKTVRRARNALRLMSGARFTPPYERPYEIKFRPNFMRLRRYEGQSVKHQTQPLLLVPPLMVTAQVYDISPPLSAVAHLADAGMDTWLCDFGIPETEEGGLERTLDEHLLAINAAIDHIYTETGKPVHVAGYSQGGLFVYQVVAYRKCKHVASVITFGSPVDFQRNLPRNFDRDLTHNVASGIRGALSGAIDNVPGLPGSLTSLAFKMVSPAKEVKFLRMMLGILDDKEALQKVEPMRRFLGGEGFIAWPGPAFRSFVDNVVVQNRMMVGGFVVNEHTVSMHDITCPILYFVGEQDEFARPPSVRAIGRVASPSEIYEVSLQCGHFGLVVGSRAMTHVWPTVTGWVDWKSGVGAAPETLSAVDVDAKRGVRQGHGRSVDDSLSTAMREFLSGAYETTGETMRELTDTMRWFRWQVPRLLRLFNLRGSGLSIGHVLEAQAEDMGDSTFFMWQDFAWSFREANLRVNRMANVLDQFGVRPGDHVGIMMDNHPDFLGSIGALNRLGAVAVLLNPGLRGDVLAHALSAGSVDKLIVGQRHLKEVRTVAQPEKLLVAGNHGDLENLLCFDTLVEKASDSLASHIEPNPGRPEDLALLMFTSGTTGLPKAARISNRRWFLAATASAAAAGLSPDDTVYCTLPLYHATGLLLGGGGALVAGCRLALGEKFSVSRFWDDVHRTGATVVFYVGELCRYLVSAPEVANEKNHSIRLFMGNGLRSDVWSQLRHRYGRVRILEFYGSTEGNVALANLTGSKIGSVGRVPFGLQRVELVKYQVDEDTYVRDERGFFVSCPDGEAGMLIAQIISKNPFSHFDGYTDREATERKILRDVFEPGDCWFATGDLLKRDADGDFWFEDRVGDTYRFKGENVSTEEVSRVISRTPFVGLATVYGVKIEEHEGRIGTAAIELADNANFNGQLLFDVVESGLAPAARPRFVRVVDRLATTASFKVIKHELQREGIHPGQVDGAIYFYDSKARSYSRLTKSSYRAVVERL